MDRTKRRAFCIGAALMAALPILLLTDSVSADLVVRSQPPGALVEFAGPSTLRGFAPFPLRQEYSGRYSVLVSSPGYETARGAVTLRARDGVLRLASVESGLRREGVLRSLLLPGYGQMKEGRRFEGLLWGFGSATAALTTLFWEFEFQKVRDDYQESSALLLRSSPSDEGYIGLLDNTFRLEANVSARRRDRDFALGAIGLYWGLGLIDAALFHGELDLREGSDGSVQVTLTRRTRDRALLRSVFYPGLGQSYLGNGGRAFLYAAGASVAGAVATMSHLRYKESLDRIDTIGREQTALLPGGPDEAEAYNRLVAERESLQRRSEDDKDRRDWAGVIAAGFWLGSLLDVLLSPAAPAGVVESGPEIGFLSTPGTGSPGFGLTHRFW